MTREGAEGTAEVTDGLALRAGSGSQAFLGRLAGPLRVFKVCGIHSQQMRLAVVP